MALEIERKFLVTGDGWRDGAKSVRSRQGYILIGPPASVRVRIMDGEAKLNLKRSLGDATREEYEYPIPLADAESMLKNMCDGRIVEKTRHYVQHAGHTWEVDEFYGPNHGLIVAEIELPSLDHPFDHPPWLGQEVTHDPRYLNSHLAVQPFNTWR